MESCIVKDKFYDLKELIYEIGKNEKGISFNEIYEYFKNAKIIVTEDKIYDFLSKKAKEDNVDMSESTEKCYLLNIAEIDVTDRTNKFMQEINKSKYLYNGYDLNYFMEYVNIIRENSLKLCLIVISIVDNKSIEEMNDILPDFENAININSGKIDGDSIQRLVQVITYNYKTMMELVDKANNLNTYLSNTVNLHSLYAKGFIESDLYPHKDLQYLNSLINVESCLALSPKQRELGMSKSIEDFKAYLEEEFLDEEFENSEYQKVLTSELKD